MDDIHTCHHECQRPICVAVREAVAAEREAIAEAVSKCDPRATPKGIATAIRARSNNGL